MSHLYRLGWFSTGRDAAARDLLTAVRDSIGRGEIKAEIAFAFCSREPGESAESDRFLKLVEGYCIPLVCFSYEKFRGGRSAADGDGLAPWRSGYDREVMRRLSGFAPELCVLAGYMLIVGAEMCRRYNMINLHPAAPGGPAGTWQEVIWQLIAAGASASGVMLHLVTPELDCGPVVAYCTFPVRGEPFDVYWAEIKGKALADIKQSRAGRRLFQLIREHGLAREFPLIIATIRAFSEGTIGISLAKQVVDAAGKPLDGYDLTGEIDRLLKGVS